MGVPSVAVFTDADESSLHVAAADESVRIGEGPAGSSYLDATTVIGAAVATGADARLALTHFGDGSVFLERLVTNARHVEVQAFGAGGVVVALGDRDCSAQRRNQKVLEEAPAPGLSDATRAELASCAVRLLAA